jgi:hypothetical protein
MIEVLKRADLLAAEYATLSLVPLGDHVPNQAIFRISLDLLQAILATVLMLGPTGTFNEPESGLIEESTNSGFSGGDIDGLRLVRLGTSDQMLAAKGEISAQAGDSSNHEKTDRQCQYSDGYKKH